MGARLHTTLSDADVDEFDDWCEHLVVRDVRDQVVGTYRVLCPDKSAQLGRWYAESEFDLSPLEPLRAKMIEVGRACVDPEHREGGVIMALWSGLGQFMTVNRYEYMLGCVSVPLTQGPQTAVDVYHHLRSIQALSDTYDLNPLRPFSSDIPCSDHPVSLPPLLKGYLRLGAKVCSTASYDADFNTADFLTLLRLEDMHPRYARHFLRS
jgi:putative hemolysin